jgi:hypothetical protein
MFQFVHAGVSITILGCNDFYSYRKQVKVLICISLPFAELYYTQKPNAIGKEKR